MTLYFAVSEGYYEVAKVVINQHIRQGLGLDYLVKVRVCAYAIYYCVCIINHPHARTYIMLCNTYMQMDACIMQVHRCAYTACSHTSNRPRQDCMAMLGCHAVLSGSCNYCHPNSIHTW